MAKVVLDVDVLIEREFRSKRAVEVAQMMYGILKTVTYPAKASDIIGAIHNILLQKGKDYPKSYVKHVFYRMVRAGLIYPVNDVITRKKLYIAVENLLDPRYKDRVILTPKEKKLVETLLSTRQKPVQKPIADVEEEEDWDEME